MTLVSLWGHVVIKHQKPIGQQIGCFASRQRLRRTQAMQGYGQVEVAANRPLNLEIQTLVGKGFPPTHRGHLLTTIGEWG